MRVFNSNNDIYNFADEIRNLAQKMGDKKTVDLIQEALYRGEFLPSERLGEMRMVLMTLINEDKLDYLAPLKSDIERAISIINKAFKKSNRPWQ